MDRSRYLFDTNQLSALIKHPVSRFAERVAALDSEAFCTSVIVACELRYGALKKGSPRLIDKVNNLLAQVTVLPLDARVEPHYAEIRVALEKAGQPIGHNDLLIAAHARALEFTLVTDNVSEFSRVPGLTVENWLIADA